MKFYFSQRVVSRNGISLYSSFYPPFFTLILYPLWYDKWVCLFAFFFFPFSRTHFDDDGWFSLGRRKIKEKKIENKNCKLQRFPVTRSKLNLLHFPLKCFERFREIITPRSRVCQNPPVCSLPRLSSLANVEASVCFVPMHGTPCGRALCGAPCVVSLAW